MAKHDVSFSVPARPLAYSDICFAVKRDGAKYGQLQVSQGGVFWVDRDRTYGHHLTWGQIAEFAKAEGIEKKR